MSDANYPCFLCLFTGTLEFLDSKRGVAGLPPLHDRIRFLSQGCFERQEIGSLEQNFVDSLVEDITAFLLGGRAWLVDHINHSDRRVRVRPAPYGKQPSWGGFIPQRLSF